MACMSIWEDAERKDKVVKTFTGGVRCVDEDKQGDERSRVWHHHLPGKVRLNYRTARRRSSRQEHRDRHRSAPSELPFHEV